PRVGRQDGWIKPNAFARVGCTVADAWLAYRHRANAGHDLALRQMPVAHQAPLAGLGLEIGMPVQEVGDLRLNGLCQQRTGAAAQNLSERIGEGPWLRELADVSVGHGVSLLQWRSGGVEHPHDTPPYPFMPSPTSAHSSILGVRCDYREKHPPNYPSCPKVAIAHKNPPDLTVLLRRRA